MDKIGGCLAHRNTLALAGLPAQLRTQGAAMWTLIRNLGGSIGVAIVILTDLILLPVLVSWVKWDPQYKERVSARQKKLVGHWQRMARVTERRNALIIVGLAVGQLLLGAISDATGRRRRLLVGAVVFTGLACPAVALPLQVWVQRRISQPRAPRTTATPRQRPDPRPRPDQEDAARKLGPRSRDRFEPPARRDARARLLGRLSRGRRRLHGETEAEL